MQTQGTMPQILKVQVSSMQQSYKQMLTYIDEPTAHSAALHARRHTPLHVLLCAVISRR